MKRKFEGIEKSGQAWNRYWVWDKRRLSQWVLGWVSNLTKLVQGSSEKVLLFCFFLPWLFGFGCLLGFFFPPKERLWEAPKTPKRDTTTGGWHHHSGTYRSSQVNTEPRSSPTSVSCPVAPQDHSIARSCPVASFLFFPSNLKNYPQAYKPLTDVSIILSLWICCLPLKQLFNCARKRMLLSWHLIYADESVDWHVVEWFQFFTKTCVNSTYWL